MFIVFCVMTTVRWLSPSCDRVYEIVRPKVDTINSHLGVGFLTPIVMLSQHDMLSGVDTARVVGAFVTTYLRLFRDSSLLCSKMRAKNSIAALLNPILSTTLLMIAYMRLKAAAEKKSLDHVLATFSSGTPLYAIWTSKITGIALSDNPSAWFGAGDAALCILEVGMVTWGFKLYECRLLAARGLGLRGPETLAFAARSTTLALAKPAVEAVGGNLVVNASLIVSNGIVGQLLYPFALDWLGWPRNKTGRSLRTASRRQADGIVTVAAGVAVGTNGAAMGVSYLYETGSHAAPYAALSMTVFGVMTVVFITVDPFKSYVEWLARSDLMGR
ncbi:lrgB-like family protein [Hirsutella rhossiliensis]|uniref:LrgB-like family domain-containing protein n=1 Tax=Hirsutella rhossiliensis TaxID=111463 RepID=A0A9P8N1L2_9HYPO|nr:lrgB-like family domain-containing protein [Hirsutella rhossiliensis]KAH0965983.1 lrgB-like family domain-containing protein [Hirsutella rhossiliensis]